jgi:hypothetical protein
MMHAHHRIRERQEHTSFTTVTLNSDVKVVHKEERCGFSTIVLIFIILSTTTKIFPLNATKAKEVQKERLQKNYVTLNKK